MAKRTAKQTLTAKCDRVFSTLVRLSKADAHGDVCCYTCGTVRHYKQMHAGHYMSRRNKSIRWHHDNARPQCPGCNQYGKVNGPGESVIFGRKLSEEGVDVDELERLGRSVRVWTEDELEVLLHDLESMLADLERKREQQHANR